MLGHIIAAARPVLPRWARQAPHILADLRRDPRMALAIIAALTNYSADRRTPKPDARAANLLMMEIEQLIAGGAADVDTVRPTG
jgi:hypothetical protein